jgi:hypothetical protein
MVSWDAILKELGENDWFNQEVSEAISSIVTELEH